MWNNIGQVATNADNAEEEKRQVLKKTLCYVTVTEAYLKALDIDSLTPTWAQSKRRQSRPTTHV